MAPYSTVALAPEAIIKVVMLLFVPFKISVEVSDMVTLNAVRPVEVDGASRLAVPPIVNAPATVICPVPL